MRRILYDTNVILDVLLERQPHFGASAAALDAVGRGSVEGYVSAHAVTTIAYLLERRLGSARSRKALADLLSKMRVAPVTDAVIRQALNSRINDFEDAVCHAAAVEADVSMIVTRNAADFSKGAVPAVLPEVFRG
ncbi:MAG: nucleic-acid-binding protein, contains PIN domain protein [Nitrospirae bacterium RBG_16_64_22]|nr:MAG: nucleic-acid-binding protein, contains PIN domain protein [Nitrospirae bacterium RBG_16_64_22]